MAAASSGVRGSPASSVKRVAVGQRAHRLANVKGSSGSPPQTGACLSGTVTGYRGSGSKGRRLARAHRQPCCIGSRFASVAVYPECIDMPANISRRPPGRPVGWRKPPLAARPASAHATFSVDRWCQEADVSRTWLYGLWAVGNGPAHVRVGGRVLITESPREYLARVARAQQKPTAPEAA